MQKLSEADQHQNESRFVYAFMVYSLPCLLYTLLILFALPLRFDTFTGDDLTMLVLQKAGTCASKFSQVFTDALYDKYRPISSLLFWITYKWFGSSFRLYILLNTIVHSFSAALLGAIIFKISRNLVFGALFSFAFVSSRFAYYNLMQRFGLMESVALLFGMLSLVSLVVYWQKCDFKYWCYSVCCFAIAIFTHERYLVLWPILTAIYFWRKGSLSLVNTGTAMIPLAIVLVNLFIKKWVLGIHVLTGTGGEQIEFSLASTFGFWLHGLFNILGFNCGPIHLAAYNSSEFGFLGFVPLFLLALCSTILLICYLKKGLQRLWLGMFFVCILSGLLLTASITFRQEFRWLFAPQVVLIGGFLLGVSAIDSYLPRHTRNTILALFFIGNACADALMYRSVKNIYFYGWLTEGEELREIVVEPFKTQLGRKVVYIVDGWINPKVIKVYSEGSRVSILSIHSDVLGGLSNNERKSGLFFTRIDGRLRNISISETKAVGADEKLLTVTGDDVAVIPELADLVDKADGDWYFSLQVGTRLEARNPRKAEYYLRQSIAYDKTFNPYPYFELGRLYEKGGDFRMAFEYYQMAVKYDDAKQPNPAFLKAELALKRLMGKD